MRRYTTVTQHVMTMTVTMTIKLSLFDINHLHTMIGENKAEKKINVVNEKETIQNNRSLISQANPLKFSLI